MQESRYFNRDLSWLAFNKRVLDEAADKELPLYERINFLAIYANNLDEFFRVRVASYRKLLLLPQNEQQRLSTNPKEILKKINRITISHLVDFNRIFEEEIIEELKRQNIYILDDTSNFTKEQLEYVEELFFNNIIPHTHPMLLVKNRVAPFLQNNVLYFMLKMHKKRKKKSVSKPQPRYAIVRIPSQYYSRFVEIPQANGGHYVMFLDDVVKMNLKTLFPGYKIDGAYSFMLTRDADLMIEDEFDGDLIDTIQKNLLKREVGVHSRFIYDHRMPKNLLKVLKSNFDLDDSDLVEGGSYLRMNDLFSFPNPLKPELERAAIPTLGVAELDQADSLFKAIKKKEYLLHFPYQSYKYVIRFLNEAAIDPKVEKILVTQYRVAQNSAVVNALIGAAKNGKSVTVFVEVKARFDEAANLHFAREMEQAGIKIIYSIPGIKVHAKVALVLRKESSNYAFLSTGNFNEKTAELYADFGFFTKRTEIIEDLVKLFDYLENQQSKPRFSYLHIGQFNLYKNTLKLIEREITNKKNGGEGRMILKMNGLQEPKVIQKLYEASEAGVQIDLIVRGICCLKPEQPYSQNIRVRRIVDRYLEHARAFYFYNNGEDEVYLSSADWMNRNLHRRIECSFRIEDDCLKEELKKFFEIQLADVTSARFIDENLENQPIEGEKSESNRAQMAMYNYLNNKAISAG